MVRVEDVVRHGAPARLLRRPRARRRLPGLRQEEKVVSESQTIEEVAELLVSMCSDEHAARRIGRVLGDMDRGLCTTLLLCAMERRNERWEEGDRA